MLRQLQKAGQRASSKHYAFDGHPVYSHVQAFGGQNGLTHQPSRYTSTAVPQLTAPQLLNAAKLAKLSGACYLPESQLEGFLADEQLQLHASGNTHFTR